MPLAQLEQDVDVAHDQRGLRDHLDREAPIPQQRLENLPGEAEAPLGGLVGIGGGADDQSLAAEPRRIERSGEDVGRAGLHEDAALECLPVGQWLRGASRFAPPL